MDRGGTDAAADDRGTVVTSAAAATDAAADDRDAVGMAVGSRTSAAAAVDGVCSHIVQFSQATRQGVSS